MATWRDISAQQARAAKRLVGADVVRPSISRAYYAAYSGVVHALHRQGLRRFGGRGNPDHADVPALVLHNLSSLDQGSRRIVAKSLRRLRVQREDADYRPHRVVDRGTRLRAIWEMDRALSVLGMPGAHA